MRKTELARFTYLIEKQKRGETLSEAETTRLNDLALIARRDREKEERRTNGNGNPNSNGTSVRGVDHDSLGYDLRADTQESGGGSARGGANETGNGRIPTNEPRKDSRPSTSGNGENREGGGLDRDNARSNATANRGDQRTGGGDPRDPRTDADAAGSTGTALNPVSGSGEKAERPREISDLIPKDIAPKRKVGKPQKSKKATGGALDTDSISDILMAGFGLISILSKKDHWQITKDEAESIAAPIETMLASIPAKTKAQIEKLTAPAILGAAIAGVVMPRIIIDMTDRKRGIPTHGTKTDTGNQSEAKRDRPRDVIDAPKNDRGAEAPDAPPSNIPIISAKIAGLFDDSNKSAIGG